MPSRNPSARHSIALSAALLLIATAGLSCSKAHSDSAEDTTPANASDSAPAAQVTEANSLAFLMAANSAEIDDAKLASSQSSSSAVKAFATMMSTQHQGVKDQLTALADSVSISPQDDDASRELATASDSERQSLQGLHGTAFDRAYLDHAIEAHQGLLDALDQRLIPNSANSRVRQALVTIRSAVESHLSEAKRVRGSIES